MYVMFSLSLLDSFLSLFSHDLAIDMGSENLRIFVKNKGLAVNEPLVAVVNRKSKQIITSGKEAKKMVGRVPEHVKIVKPVFEGVIVDFDTLSLILKRHIELLHRSYGIIPKIPKPKVLLGVPQDISQVEKKALKDVIKSAGARKVVLISRLQAAAVGAGFNFSSKKGVLIVDFGATVTEIGIASGSGLIVSKILKIGGRTLNQAIINFIRLKYGVFLGEEIAEEIKIAIGSLPNTKRQFKEKFFVARGRDMESSLPRSLKISSSEINETLMTSVNIILETIREIIEKSPPEFLADVSDLGIILVGGSSLLQGLPEVIGDTVKTSAWVAKNPELSLIKGMGAALTNDKILRVIKI